MDHQDHNLLSNDAIKVHEDSSGLNLTRDIDREERVVEYLPSANSYFRTGMNDQREPEKTKELGDFMVAAVRT